MSKAQIKSEIKKQQEIQMTNPPSSVAWQEASKRLHELIEQLTGSPVKDAWGKR